MSGGWGRMLWSGLLLGLISVAGSAAALHVWWPPAAAAICPVCYGFERLNGRVWVEPSLAPAKREHLLKALGQARGDAARLFGELRADPVILVCARMECDRALGGNGLRAISSGWHVIRVAPHGMSTVVLTHEIAHAEMRWRVGPLAVLSGRYPAWFDEGLAVLVSRDPGFLEVDGLGAPRCKREWSDGLAGELPRSGLPWAPAAVDARASYGRAACRAAQWYASAGRDGLLQLIDEIRGGEKLEVALARDRSRRLPRGPSTFALAVQ